MNEDIQCCQVCAAITDAGHQPTADAIQEAKAAGTPWVEIVTKMLELTLPAFLKWLESKKTA